MLQTWIVLALALFGLLNMQAIATAQAPEGALERVCETKPEGVIFDQVIRQYQQIRW